MSTLAEIRKSIKSVAKTNAQFERATPEKKRVMIARDVLRQLRVGRIQASSFYFIPSHVADGPAANEANRKFWDSWRDARHKPDAEVRDLLLKQPHCTACAIGAAFVCAVDRLDKLKVAEFGFCRDAMVRYLERTGLFTALQLGLMECAFEGYTDTTNVGSEVGHFNDGVSGPRKRLERVMRAIVDAKGVVDASTFA